MAQQRPPSFKPTDGPQTVTYCGPIIRGNSGTEQMTWTDDKGKIFYLYTLADSGGMEMTWFLKGYQAKMLTDTVPVGQQFTVRKYGRPMTNGGFFGDLALTYDNLEVMAETWDEGPTVSVTPAGVAAAPQQQQQQPQQQRPPQQQQNTQQPPAAGRQAPDDVGMFAECMVDAAMALFSEPVIKTLARLGYTADKEDLMTRSSTLMIGRRQAGETQPRRTSFAKGTLKFDFPDEDDTQESPAPQTPAPAEETKEAVAAGSAEEDDLPF